MRYIAEISTWNNLCSLLSTSINPRNVTQLKYPIDVDQRYKISLEYPQLLYLSLFISLST